MYNIFKIIQIATKLNKNVSPRPIIVKENRKKITKNVSRSKHSKKNFFKQQIFYLHFQTLKSKFAKPVLWEILS